MTPTEEKTLASNDITPLDLIGVRAGTDKSRLRHDYLRHYEPILHRFKNEDVTIVEIGIHNGASLDVWKEYFKSARIIGLDIAPVTKNFAGGRVQVEIGSQFDGSFLKEIGESVKPTIILDDGSHIDEHQIFSFQTLMPFVQPNGIYIVEDVGPTGQAQEFFLSQASRVFLGEKPFGVTSFETIPQAFIFKKAPIDAFDKNYAALERIARESRLLSESLLYLAEYMQKNGQVVDDVVRVATDALSAEPNNPWINLFLSKRMLDRGDVSGAWNYAQASVDWARRIGGSMIPTPIQMHYEAVESLTKSSDG